MADRKNLPSEHSRDFLGEVFDRKNPLLGSINEFFNGVAQQRIPVEKIETDKHIIYEARLPGISKEEIDIDLLRDHLRIKVNRKQEEIAKGYQESKQMKLERLIYLPANISVDGMKATHRDGLLRIKFPKVKGKKIEIE
ncbi:Hsp20/alpha crystallin family protein [Bacillaceae bacterium S4-13-58]